MTQLLVSVRSASEAQVALEGGATIIDVKEPTKGSLGRADASTWQQVAQVIRAQRQESESPLPLSVALGELHDLATFPGEFPAGISLAKVGLAGLRAERTWQLRWQKWRHSLPIGVQAVAVAYADATRAAAPDPAAVLQLAVEQNVPTLLLDTFHKSAGSILEIVSPHWLQEFCGRVREAGLQLALAGSLKSSDLASALLLQPDIVAVRTAACASDRTSSISLARVQALVQALALPSSHTVASAGVSSLPGSSVNPANDKKTNIIAQAAG